MRGTKFFLPLTKSNSPLDEAKPTHLIDLSRDKALITNLSRVASVVGIVIDRLIRFSYKSALLLQVSIISIAIYDYAAHKDDEKGLLPNIKHQIEKPYLDYNEQS